MARRQLVECSSGDHLLTRGKDKRVGPKAALLIERLRASYNQWAKLVACLRFSFLDGGSTPPISTSEELLPILCATKHMQGGLCVAYDRSSFSRSPRELTDLSVCIPNRSEAAVLLAALSHSPDDLGMIICFRVITPRRSRRTRRSRPCPAGPPPERQFAPAAHPGRHRSSRRCGP